MKRSRLDRMILSALLIGAMGCGGATFLQVAGQHPQERIAIVAFSIHDYQGSLQGWNSTITGPLMADRTAYMLSVAEQNLAQHYQVISTASFVPQAGFQQFAGPGFDVAVPAPGGAPMMPVADSNRQLVRGTLSPQKAQALAQLTGANLLALVYAEWGVQTGGLIPTSKALSKTVLSIVDASGRQIYYGRNDQVGSRTLGAFGRVVVDENSVGEWVQAYEVGFATLLAR